MRPNPISLRADDDGDRHRRRAGAAFGDGWRHRPYRGPGACKLRWRLVGALYLPAIAAIGGVAVLAAPAGAAVAHVLPVPILRRIFAALLLSNAFVMSWRIIPPLPAIGPAILREAAGALLDPLSRPNSGIGSL